MNLTLATSDFRGLTNKVRKPEENERIEENLLRNYNAGNDTKLCMLGSGVYGLFLLSPPKIITGQCLYFLLSFD